MNAPYLACGGWIATAVGAAATHGIADLLVAGPRSARELADATGTSEPVLTAMMDLLSEAGVFAREDDRRFANTKNSALLRSEHPQSMRHFCRLASGTYQEAFNKIEHSLRAGEPATLSAFGSTLYDHLDAHPDAADIYDKAMEDLSRPAASALPASRDFSKVRLMVDVGGGRGLLVRGVLQNHPHVRGIVIDRRDVCERAAADLRATDPAMADRVEFSGVSFFDSVPAGADLYTLKNVLHNWGDEAAVQILQRVRTAMSAVAGSRLLIIEPVIGGHMPPMYQALDAMMQILVGQHRALARSEDAFRRLVAQANLHVSGVSALESGHTVIEVSA